MTNDNFLWMQKAGEAKATSTETWGICLQSMPMLDSMEAKEPDKNDWLDEDGEDVYLPSTLRLKAFDAEVGMICKGSMTSIQAAFKGLLTYLTNYGTDLRIYNDYVKQGRQHCYFKSTTAPEFDGCDDEFFATWKVTFRVTDPLTDIHCVKSGQNYILTL